MENRVPALSQHANVYDTALVLVERKGFRVWQDQSRRTFWAEKDGWDFLADDPLGLLGLVTIWEHLAPSEYSEYWWRLRRERSYSKLPTTKPTYAPVYRAKSSQTEA